MYILLNCLIRQNPSFGTVNDQIGCFASVEGKSMQPTLNPEENGKPRHEWVLVNRFRAHSYKYRRGDIVMLRSPRDPKRYLVKRIIGLPGDWIQLENNKLIEVDKGRCWIEGDNYKNSIDSYSFGQVPLALLEGTVQYVLFPFRCRRSLPRLESTISRVIICLLQSLFVRMVKDPLQIVNEYGFQLSDEGIQFVKDMDSKYKQNPVQYMLNNHIKMYSRAVLPADQNAVATTLKGKFILQIMSITNIAAPTINQASSISPRMLKVRLTDGITSMYAIEYEPIPQLKLDTPPGTKVLLTNPEIFNGRILLRPSMISVLGGIVQDVYEAWKNQEMMAMKNKYRKAIRDASLSPPKFISFTDFIKQRKKPAPTKSSKPQKPISETAGVLPEMKKLEELDLEKITDLRKEALDGINPALVKEMGKWGSAKSNEKKPEPLRKSQPKPQRTDPPKVERVIEPKAKPKQIEIKRKAKLVDLSLNTTIQEINCMLQIERSIVTLPVTKRLYTYLIYCSDDGKSLKGIKEELVGDEFDFGFITENGSEKISSLLDEELIIPPPDFVIPQETKHTDSSRPTRAFFKRPVRRRGRGGHHSNARGKPTNRGGHGSRGRGNHHFFVFYNTLCSIVIYSNQVLF